MLEKVRKILSLLSPDEKRNLIFLCFLMVLNALLEVLGIASVAPLIAVITSPETMESMPFIQNIYDSYGFTSFRDFSIALGFVILVIILLSNAMILFTSYLAILYANNREYTIGQRLLKTYIYQPYSFFLTRHSTELLRNIFNEVAYIISNVIMQSLQLLSRSISALAIIIFVFIIHPQVTMIMGLILGGAYTLIYLFVKTPLYKLGKENVAMTEGKLKSISDSIKIIRDIKMLGAESIFINRFEVAAKGYARVRTLSDIASIAPRYIIEVFAISALVVSIIYLISTQENANEVLPILGIYAFASYRLMPALQLIFNALSRIQFSAHSLDIVAGELENLQDIAERNVARTIDPISFKKSFGLRDIGFSYTSEEVVLKDISLNIDKGEKIGIIGGSGAGKSTLVDLLVGLTAPNSGGLYIDGQLLDPTEYPGWRQNIAYISQNVYLLDDTIDMNISLADQDSNIDTKLAEHARKQALVDEFLADMNETPQLVTGENGIRLSGGQRQRIGIARALYQNRDILILDEATSALDQDTEKRLLENISHENKTMVLITHRVETLQFCDRIYILVDGKITDTGSYEELQSRSEHFKRLAKSAGD